MSVVTYRNSIVLKNIGIYAGQLESDALDLSGISEFGAVTLRRLIFPTEGWSNCDVGFKLLDTLPHGVTVESPLRISDLVNDAPYVLLSQPPGSTISLIPYGVDSAAKIKLTFSVAPTANGFVTAAVCPLYQVPA